MCAVSNQESLCRELPLNVVDLWFAKLPENDFSLEALLSPDEMRRALRFRFDSDMVRHMRFEVSRLQGTTHVEDLKARLENSISDRLQKGRCSARDLKDAIIRLDHPRCRELCGKDRLHFS